MATVLFVFAHADDETLAMSVAITEHVDPAAGHAVHALLLSHGKTSVALNYLNGLSTSSWWGVRHVPADEGYTLLTPEEFGIARVRECGRALDCLSSGLGQITFHDGGLDTAWTAEQAAQVILNVADAIAPGQPVRLKSHTHLVDDHPEHRATGEAVRLLKLDDPGRFGDVRHYVLAPYWTDPRLAGLTVRWDEPATPAVAARAINACRVYASWAPPYAYAVGMHSVPTYFAPLLTGPRCMYHS